MIRPSETFVSVGPGELGAWRTRGWGLLVAVTVRVTCSGPGGLGAGGAWYGVWLGATGEVLGGSGMGYGWVPPVGALAALGRP